MEDPGLKGGGGRQGYKGGFPNLNEVSKLKIVKYSTMGDSFWEVGIFWMLSEQPPRLQGGGGPNL